MKPNTQLLHSVWENFRELISKKDVELEKINLDELIASIFSNGPFYFYIVDFYDMKIKYMSPMVREIHGLDPEIASFQDILDQIHPDDLAFVAKAEAAVWDILYNTLGSERNKKYKMSYCFRFRTSDGSYQLFNHQSLIITTDENGGLAKSLNIHTNISHLTSQNNYQVSAIGMLGEPSYLNIKINEDAILPQPTKPLFSKREVEIIRLMSEGYTNISMADKLFIAHNTIKNHRKNILHKAGCKNLGQLITKCMTEGLI
jgi:DNA-binding CsgD family transcriptional regulator